MTYHLSRIKYDVVERPLAGQILSGDGYFIKETENLVLIAVIDGLGHGEDASFATKKAIQILDNNVDEPLLTLVTLCDEALLTTRGVAITFVRIDLNHMLSYVSIGNVIGVCWTRNDNLRLIKQSFFLEGGIVGCRLPREIKVRKISLSTRDIIILATDGIKVQFENEDPTLESTEKIANKIFDRYQNKNDDSLVFVAQLI